MKWTTILIIFLASISCAVECQTTKSNSTKTTKKYCSVVIALYASFESSLVPESIMSRTAWTLPRQLRRHLQPASTMQQHWRITSALQTVQPLTLPRNLRKIKCNQTKKFFPLTFMSLKNRSCSVVMPHKKLRWRIKSARQQLRQRLPRKWTLETDWQDCRLHNVWVICYSRELFQKKLFHFSPTTTTTAAM